MPASCPALTHDPLDSIGGVNRILVLPYTNNLPAGCLQLLLRVSVAPLVPLDLLAPERLVCSGPDEMLRAAMPETSIDENDHARGPEDDVGAPASIRQNCAVDAETKATCMQQTTECDLGSCVASSESRHEDAARFGRWDGGRVGRHC